MQIFKYEFPENISFVKSIVDANGMKIINTNYKGDKNIMKNLMCLNNNGFQWTSKDIVEWTGKRHADIMKDIRDESNKLGNLAEGIFSLGSYKDTNNQERPMYKLNKKGIQQIAARYDAAIRYKIIDRMEKLESGIPKQFSLKESLELNLQLLSDNEKLQLERDIAIQTKAQISSSREAKVMGIYGNAVRKIKKLESQVDKFNENDKKPGEYTAFEAAQKMKVFSISGRPHEQLICKMFYSLKNNIYGRKVRLNMNGHVVPSLYVNDSFIKEAYKKIKKYANSGEILLNRKYKFKLL